MKELIKARIRLVKKQPFFGRLCLQFPLQESNEVPTAGTDGEYFYYNKEFVESLTEDELLGVFVHETLHAALGHMWRRDKRDPHRWNIAADYVVNLIAQENGFILPRDALSNYQYANMSVEEVYDKLPPSIKMDVCPRCMGEDGQGSQKKGKKAEANGGSGNKKGRKAKCPCGGSHKLWEKAKFKKNAKELERKWQAAVEQAVKTQGHIPSGFERFIKEIAPKEDWRRILQNYLSSSSTDFDFMRRDRRSMNSPFYFPDMYDEEQLENVVVALDTSGSISTEQLNRYISEVRSILKDFPKVTGWVIDCDAEVGKIVPIEKASVKASYYGGGGTSHVPVFNAIRKKNLNPKVCICFTDLYTDFPRTKPNYPVLWLTEESSRDMTVPFGRIIVMKE